MSSSRLFQLVKRGVRRLIPQLTACLDESPRITKGGEADLSSPLSLPKRFSGWVFYPQGPVELRFEVAGRPLDIFYPCKERKDVQEHIAAQYGKRLSQKAFYAGFVKEYSHQSYEVLTRAGAELVVYYRSHFSGQQMKRVLWSAASSKEPLGDSDAELNDLVSGQLEAHFPLFRMTKEHSYSSALSKDLHLVLVGDVPVELLGSIIKEAPIYLGASVKEVWSTDLTALPSTVFPHAKKCDSNIVWDEFLQQNVKEPGWILYLDGRRTLDQESLRSFLQTIKKYHWLSLFRPVLESESNLHPGQELVSVSDFDSIWLGRDPLVASVGAGRRISEPLVKKKSYRSVCGHGHGVSSAHISREGLRPIREYMFPEDQPSYGIALPYRFSSDDRHEEAREKYLEQLLIQFPESIRSHTAFIVRDTKGLKGLRLHGLPIFTVEEVANSFHALERESSPSFLVLATDCWSVRLCHLLQYAVGASVGVVDEPLESESWYAELRESSEAGGAADWKKWHELPSYDLQLFEKNGFRPGLKKEKNTPSKLNPDYEGGISFIIPVFNAIEHVVMCVRSLIPQLEVDDEVVLVNDSSDKGTSNYLKRIAAADSRIKLIEREQNGGFIEACYSGLKASVEKNDIVLLNSDVVCSDGLVRALRRALLRAPGASLFSPFSTGSRKLQIDMPPGESLQTVSEHVAQFRVPTYPTVITPEGQCLIIRRSAIEQMSFFDRVYHRGFCEESDYSMRLFLHGADMAVVDDALIYHEQSASFGSQQRMIQLARNRPIFDGRWGVEYEIAFEAYEQKGEVEAVKQQLALPVDEESLPVAVEHGDEVEFVQKVRSAKPTGLSVDSEHFKTKWLDQAEVVFILPAIVGGGGSLSVLQHVNEMLLQGIEARVISLGKQRLDDYPMLTKPVSMTPEEVLQLPWGAQHVVATFWTTAHLVNAVKENYPTVSGYYYIQDYEAWFYEEGSEERSLAAETYDFPLQRVAKTQFLCDTVKEHHGGEVLKITPGIDRLVFYPNRDIDQVQHAPHFVAMYRPSTPRRGGDRLIHFFELLKERLPEAQCSLFGDTETFPASHADGIRLHGRLSRKGVAALYREADFVVDLSYFHGFGRMGIEAMACGAIPILTSSGGVSEYAKDEDNSLVIDADDLDRSLARVVDLWCDRSRRIKMQQAAMNTADLWSEWKATTDWVRCMGITSPRPDTFDICRFLFHRDERVAPVVGESSLSVAQGS